MPANPRENKIAAVIKKPGRTAEDALTRLFRYFGVCR